jgi:hypothetical protein
VVAESSSEAVFIASRLQEQDEQLAQHAKDAGDGPLLANAHAKAAAAAGSGAAASAAGDSDSANDNAEDQEEEGNVDVDWGSSSSTEAAEAPAGEQEAAAAVAGDGDGAKKVKFRPLQPLIVLRMTGEGAAVGLHRGIVYLQRHS